MTPKTRQPTRPQPPAPSQAPPALPATGGARPGTARAAESSLSGPSRTEAVEAPRSPSGAAWLLLLPLLCCGGPALIAVAASAGALGWGALGAGIAAVITVGALIGRRHVRRSGKPASGQAPRHPQATHLPDRGAPR